MANSSIAPLLTSIIGEFQRILDQIKTEGDKHVPPDARRIWQELITLIDAQRKTAERPFTVAVVGEFKVGKSTFLNGLLRLSGDDRLSTQDSPDTAVSTLMPTSAVRRA